MVSVAVAGSMCVFGTRGLPEESGHYDACEKIITEHHEECEFEGVEDAV